MKTEATTLDRVDLLELQLTSERLGRLEAEADAAMRRFRATLPEELQQARQAHEQRIASAQQLYGLGKGDGISFVTGKISRADRTIRPLAAAK